MNKPARFKLCELRRAEQVAEECNRIVEIVDGKIRIVPNSGDIGENPKSGNDNPKGVVLL